jgi:ABC-type amino acid transport substrate-binding protein
MNKPLIAGVLAAVTALTLTACGGGEDLKPITDEASLKQDGVTVSAQIGTTGLAWSKEQGLNVKEFKDLGLQVKALQTGDVQASVGDLDVLEPYAKDGLKIAFEIPTGDKLGIGVKKGNDALLAAVDSTLDQIKGDGTYASLFKQWFNKDPKPNQLETSGAGAAFDPTQVKLVKDGTLTVCTNPPYEPFEIEDNGTITGFDLALVGEVAKNLGGLTVEPVATPFETIESGAALETNTCDLLASGITITDVRKAKFDFSSPYFELSLGVRVKDESK